MGESGVNLEQINLKFTSSAGNVSSTFSALENRLTKLNATLNSLNTASLDRFTAQVEKLGNAMARMNTTTTADKTIRNLATSMNRMSNVDVASVSNATNALTSMSNAMRTFPVLDETKASAISQFATALNAFGRVKSVKGIDGLGNLANQIRQFETAMEGMDVGRFQQVAAAIQQLANAFNVLGRAKADKAIQNLPLLAKEMENLMTSLARAPTISTGVIRMTEAMAKLTSNGSKVGTATASLNRNLNRTASAGTNGARGLSIFNSATKSSKAHVKSLASTIGGLIAKYWILWRAIQMLGNMAGVASSLVEVQNVVDHTFGQMQGKLEDFKNIAIDTFGLAELQVKQYASRFQSMGMSMGITNQMVANTADFVSSKMPEEAKAIYNTSESLADMSINLTKLAGDYASFYDVDPAEAFEKFQSVLTGQTRPLTLAA